MNTKWLVKNWFRVGHKISWKLSFETAVSLLYFLPAFKNELVYGIVKKKHKYVLDSLYKDFSFIVDKFKSLPIYPVSELKHRYIWVMWWQGEAKAPELVRMCINSIRKNANGADVIVISEENYKDYVDLPEYIISKHKVGIISFAQLSDIMRVFLIAEHGGLWLDSTILVSNPIPEGIFNQPLFSLHTPFKKTPFVQNDRLHCFVLGGTPNSKPFLFEREFLSTYWKNKDVIIDYYLLDYSFMLQYFSMPDIKDLIDNLDYIGEGVYDLVSILETPYSIDRVNKILLNNTFSKLVWNKKHRKTKTYSVYQYLTDQYL